MAEPPQEDVERLYGLDLDEFIPARDATARRLRSDGRRGQADHVKALRKPSDPAWIVNRLARAEAGVVGELLAAGGSGRAARPGSPTSRCSPLRPLLAASLRRRRSRPRRHRRPTRARPPLP